MDARILVWMTALSLLAQLALHLPMTCADTRISTTKYMKLVRHTGGSGVRKMTGFAPEEVHQNMETYDQCSPSVLISAL